MDGHESGIAPSSVVLVPAAAGPRDLLRSPGNARSVASARKRWQQPEGLLPEDVKAVIAAAGCDRDRLLLRCLWATGGRVSEVLALRPRDVRRDALVLPNRKNPGRPVKTVFLSADDQDL